MTNSRYNAFRHPFNANQNINLPQTVRCLPIVTFCIINNHMKILHFSMYVEFHKVSSC